MIYLIEVDPDFDLNKKLGYVVILKAELCTKRIDENIKFILNYDGYFNDHISNKRRYILNIPKDFKNTSSFHMKEYKILYNSYIIYNRSLSLNKILGL